MLSSETLQLSPLMFPRKGVSSLTWNLGFDHQHLGLGQYCRAFCPSLHSELPCPVQLLLQGVGFESKGKGGKNSSSDSRVYVRSRERLRALAQDALEAKAGRELLFSSASNPPPHLQGLSQGRASWPLLASGLRLPAVHQAPQRWASKSKTLLVLLAPSVQFPLLSTSKA